MATTVSATMLSTLSVVKTYSGGASADNTVTFNPQSETVVLNAGTSPAATKAASFSQALTAGAATIDLTALPGDSADETVVGTDLKVQLAKFTNPSTNANSITVTFGASNGYLLGGTAWKYILSPGQSILVNTNAASPTIDATHRNIDLAGTASQALTVQFVMG